MKSGLLRLVEYMGSQQALANQLMVDKSAVSQWVHQGYLPPLRAIEMEELTHGKFKAADLIKK